jgi:hypothetical protein
MQAFEMCVVREWNLSYSCLTGYAARSMLRGLRDSNPKFWDELTKKEFDAVVPPEDAPQPEDTLSEENHNGIDDSDVPIQSVINNIIHNKIQKGYVILPDHGGIEANADAERFCDVDEVQVDEEKLGRGKRKRKPNNQYSSFWRHSDSENDE